MALDISQTILKDLVFAFPQEPPPRPLISPLFQRISPIGCFLLLGELLLFQNP
jgi:hypothetical protein